LQRREIPELDWCGIRSNCCLRKAESATEGNTERLRQLSRKTQNNRDFGVEPSGDAALRPVDAREMIARQQVIELFRLQIHRLGDGCQIVDWQISSHARNKTRNLDAPGSNLSKPPTAIKMSSLSSA